MGEGGILCVYQLIFLSTFGIMRILKTFDNNEYQNESLKYKLNVMYEKKTPVFLLCSDYSEVKIKLFQRMV